MKKKGNTLRVRGRMGLEVGKGGGVWDVLVLWQSVNS